jgi:glutamyl-tRNA(Gln) amidotransferase subunit E
MILRSTGRVKRGLGTIRQDVNVSIKGGARVEIKGVQALNLVDKIVELEALRQHGLLQIKEELIRRGAAVDDTVFDVTSLFSQTDSKVLARSIKNGGVVLACRLAGFAGLVGREVQPGRRLGSEMSDRAKRAGVGGIFHSDELPAYGVTATEVESVRAQLQAGKEYAVIMAFLARSCGPGPGEGGHGTGARGDAPRSSRWLLGVYAATARLGPDVSGDGCALRGDQRADAGRP